MKTYANYEFTMHSSSTVNILSQSESRLTNLIPFYDKVDEEKAVDAVFLSFSKALVTVSHSILLDKVSSCGMSGFTVH